MQANPIAIGATLAINYLCPLCFKRILKSKPNPQAQLLDKLPPPDAEKPYTPRRMRMRVKKAPTEPAEL